MAEQKVDDSRHWHLDKRLNLGHLLATMSLTVAAIAAWNAQNERIARLEERVDASDRAAIVEATAIRETLAELKSEVRQVRQLLIDQIRKPIYGEAK